MKKLMVIFGLLSLSFLLLPTQELSAQNCFSKTVVAANCAGSTCGNPTGIGYVLGPLCTGPTERLCVTHEGSTLCIGQTAFARVFVNGTLVAGGNITAPGSFVGFIAPCGANIRVRVNVVSTPPLACLVGAPPPNIRYALRR